jgi:hypothetical protein
MRPKSVAAPLLSCLVACAANAAVFVGFEDLPALPGVSGTASLYEANGNSSVIGGITWDSRLRVTGGEHRTSGDLSNPLSGIPHGGDFFITNEAYPDAGNAITLGTTMVLTGAWFSQVEYYGYGHDEMTITIEAMNGGTVLGSASVVLPANLTGTTPLPPLSMEFLDTSSFLSLSGITGYRINQSPLDAGSRYWSADDFQFAAVPEPENIALVAGSLLALFGLWRKKN